jgi:hypothetical protein
MRTASEWLRICVGSVACFALLGAHGARALPAYGPLELSGSVQSYALLRHPDIDKYEFVQNRNTLRLRADYRLIQNGRMVGDLDVPWISSSHLYLLYRGVYDSAYDAAPGGSLHGIRKQRVGALEDLSADTRETLRFENVLREAYMDVSLRELPLSFRLGRQQVVWGETDSFRMLDRANPLDMTWHQTFESWDDLRIPLWMMKALWSIGQIGPLSDAFVETYWGLGDWIPAKQGFMPQYPWGIPYNDPRPPLFQALSTFSRKPVTTLYRNTELFRQGDYEQNPIDNAQVGVRFSAVTPQGLQFTLNYFYQRWAGDDGTNYAAIRAVTDQTEAEKAFLQRQAPVEFIAPYVHTAGLSLNYSDEDYTQTVYRLESVYDFGVPFSNSNKEVGLSLLQGNGLFGITKRDMWKGMLGFDRPTWIRSLNRGNTFLISGQFFWHYLVDKLPALVGNTDPAVPSSDKVRHWESVSTLLLTTMYAGGSIVPTLVYALDPVNSYNMYVGWSVDYFITNELIVRLGQNFFLASAPGSKPVFESWSIGGFNRGRSESLLRVTYQF